MEREESNSRRKTGEKTFFFAGPNMKTKIEEVEGGMKEQKL